MKYFDNLFSQPAKTLSIFFIRCLWPKWSFLSWFFFLFSKPFFVECFHFLSFRQKKMTDQPFSIANHINQNKTPSHRHIKVKLKGTHIQERSRVSWWLRLQFPRAPNSHRHYIKIDIIISWCLRQTNQPFSIANHINQNKTPNHRHIEIQLKEGHPYSRKK